MFLVISYLIIMLKVIKEKKEWLLLGVLGVAALCWYGHERTRKIDKV